MVRNEVIIRALESCHCVNFHIAERCPPQTKATSGGAKEIRTLGLLDANEARYQLRHSPGRPPGCYILRLSPQHYSSQGAMPGAKKPGPAGPGFRNFLRLDGAGEHHPDWSAHVRRVLLQQPVCPSSQPSRRRYRGCPRPRQHLRVRPERPHRPDPRE